MVAVAAGVAGRPFIAVSGVGSVGMSGQAFYGALDDIILDALALAGDGFQIVEAYSIVAPRIFSNSVIRLQELAEGRFSAAVKQADIFEVAALQGDTVRCLYGQVIHRAAANSGISALMVITVKQKLFNRAAGHPEVELGTCLDTLPMAAFNLVAAVASIASKQEFLSLGGAVLRCVHQGDSHTRFSNKEWA